MTTIDELGRQAATAARAEAAEMAVARVESGLEQLRLDVPIVVTPPRPRLGGRRWAMIGAAAALIAAAVVAVVVNASDREHDRLAPAAPSTEVTTPSTEAVATTAVTSTEVAVTTPTPVVAPSDAIAVSFDALPPAFPARSFVGMTDQTAVPYVAIGDSWIVTVDQNAPTATLIDPFSPATPQIVPLDVHTTGSIATGPGDVLYAVVQGDGIDMSLDAIALSGDRAGQVVASAPVGAVAFAEAPTGVLGHGNDGIIDRRTGATLLGYVDPTGAPVSLGRDAHTVGTILGDVGAGDLIVRDPDGNHDWHLAIRRDPSEGVVSLIPQSPVAPSSHGGALVHTIIGKDQTVVAVLAADGTGAWYSLADGWQVAASDLDGTILVRLNGGTVELARLDPPQRIDFLDQQAAPHQRVSFAVTLPTTLTTADPCTAADLDVVPTAEGAAGTVFGVLNIRNKGDEPCTITGVPDVALTDDGGNVVQSTDPALLGQPGAQPIILVRDSWASSILGPIASNVCGGNASSQLRLTIAADSINVPFPVSRPYEAQQCSPDLDLPKVPGALAVQAFTPVEANPDIVSPLDGLRIALDAPAKVRAGDVLRYDLVIPGPFDISDSDCPVYTETLANASAQLLLNCHVGEGIHATTGEPVRFHIELPIPADATPGPATLSWAPIEPASTPVTADVIIIGP